MKKYLKPETILVQIETQQVMIAISSQAVDASAAESRGGSDWDDEE